MILEKLIKKRETISLEKYPCARVHKHPPHALICLSTVVQETKLRNQNRTFGKGCGMAARHLE